MSSLLRKLKEENVRHPRFSKPDIYENVYIHSVTDEKRKKKDGSVIPSLFFLKLTQIDPETNKKTREEDFAFWPTKHDKGGDNFPWYATNLVTTLTEFLECYYTIEQLEQSFDPFSQFNLTAENYEQEVKKVLGVKKNMDAFNEIVKNLFMAHVNPLIENSEYNLPIRIKIVPSNDGKFLGLADQNWAESMTQTPAKNSKLQINEYDMQLIAKWENLKTGKPAVSNNPPMASTMGNPTGASIPGANMPGAAQTGIPSAPAPGNSGGNAPTGTPAQPNTIPTSQPAQPQQTTEQPAPAEQNVQQQVPTGSNNPMANAGNPVANANAGNPNANAPVPGFPQNNGGNAPKADAGMPNPFNNGQAKAF